MAARACIMIAPLARFRRVHFAEGGSGQVMESQIRQTTFVHLDLGITV